MKIPGKFQQLMSLVETDMWPDSRKMPSWIILAVFVCFWASPALSAILQQDIVDAILGRQLSPGITVSEMDLNQDGVVDVADVLLIDFPVVTFVTATSSANEIDGSVAIQVQFSKALYGTLAYTVGGSTTAGTDYTSPSGTVTVNGTTAVITISLISDTVYEGNETIEISFLPHADYLLGQIRRHVVTLQDNTDATTADYLFNLSRLTMGVTGDTTAMQGFPETILSRNASVAMTFSSSTLVDAVLNEDKSRGFTDTDTLSNLIAATLVSYDGSTMILQFDYESTSSDFSTGASLTSFKWNEFNIDPNDFGVNQPKKIIQNTLVIQIDNFNITTDTFSDALLEGTFTHTVKGLIKSESGQFFQGLVRGTMQQ